jgi:hypothetical protein
MRRAWLHKHNASNKLQGFFRSKAGGRSVSQCLSVSLARDVVAVFHEFAKCHKLNQA